MNKDEARAFSVYVRIRPLSEREIKSSKQHTHSYLRVQDSSVKNN